MIRTQGPLPSFTAKKKRGSEAEQNFHFIAPVPGEATTSWSVILRGGWPAAVPVMVAVYVPTGVAPRFSGTTVEELPAVELGVIPAKSVAGSPVTVNATGPVNPAFLAMVMIGL
jgi:hypothetical protein